LSYEHILLERRDGIASLVLNRPDARNAMSPEMGQEVAAAVEELNADREVRVVVVRGAGKAFSAGGNLQALEQEAAAARSGGSVQGRGLGGGRNFYRAYLSVRRLEVPSIAAIHGHAVGAGLCFALGCDLRVMHESAKTGMTFVRLGIHPGMAATWTLPRLIGPARAAELLYTGKLIDAAQALSWGLVNHVAGDDFDAVVNGLAAEIASSGPVAVRAVKRTLRGSFDRDIEESLGHEADAQAMTFGTADALEGIRAIQEKRAPRFHGN
jgi:enoyl-CoA hydratase